MVSMWMRHAVSVSLTSILVGLTHPSVTHVVWWTQLEGRRSQVSSVRSFHEWVQHVEVFEVRRY